jgi:hypothetical protein
VRLSELLGRQVVDENGESLGSVVDVRAVQDGPVLGGADAALRVDALVVGRRGVGVRLGYHRLGVRGPWPLKALFRHLARRLRDVPWDDVVRLEDGGVRIRGTAPDGPG